MRMHGLCGVHPPPSPAGIITHLHELRISGQRPTEKTVKADFNQLCPKTINTSLSHMNTGQIARMCVFA